MIAHKLHYLPVDTDTATPNDNEVPASELNESYDSVETTKLTFTKQGENLIRTVLSHTLKRIRLMRIIQVQLMLVSPAASTEHHTFPPGGNVYLLKGEN